MHTVRLGMDDLLKEGHATEGAAGMALAAATQIKRKLRYRVFNYLSTLIS